MSDTTPVAVPNSIASVIIAVSYVITAISGLLLAWGQYQNSRTLQRHSAVRSAMARKKKLFRGIICCRYKPGRGRHDSLQSAEPASRHHRWRSAQSWGT